MSNTLDSYYGNLGKFKLLTASQEVELAKKIEAGDTFSRDLMISSNLRLALSIANKYRKAGFPMEDIIQESNVGLIKAVDRFDWRKGFRFSTYACWWIKQSIRRYLALQGHVKFPTGSRHLIWKINHLRSEYENEFGVMPEDSEIGTMLGLPTKQISTLRRAMQWPINIDAPIGGEDGSRTYADVIPDDQATDPGLTLDMNHLIIAIRGALSSLKPQEERVLRLRFGLEENSISHNNFPITESELKLLKEA